MRYALISFGKGLLAGAVALLIATAVMALGGPVVDFRIVFILAFMITVFL